MTIQTYHRPKSHHDSTQSSSSELLKTLGQAVESLIPSKSQPWPGASFQITGITMNPAHALNSPLMKAQLLHQSQPT